MHEDLLHLSDEEVATLIQKYYSGESNTKLIQEYDLGVQPQNLFKLFPPEVFDNYQCEYCDSALVLNRRSKSMKDAPKYERELYCPVCGHRPFTHCVCVNCVQAELNLKTDRLEQIKECYSRPRAPVDFNSLTFENKVYLGALCRAQLHENMFELMPYSDSAAVLAPSNNLCREIYHELSRTEVITVSPLSPLDSFVLEDDNFPNRYYTYKVIYNLNLRFPPNKQDLFTEMLNPTYYSSEVSAEALDLWRKIAVAECLEYLEFQLKSVGFDFSPGEKTYKTFEIILNDFSVSQIYGIIWKAVADASKLYLEKGLSKNHAANSVIGACERYAGRAKINHWDLTGYRRIRDLPQSILSIFFFNRVLGIGDMGFEVPPTIV